MDEGKQPPHLSFEEQCQKAAKALAEADILLVVAGAGFSADSGLAVYGDIAKIDAYKNRNDGIKDYADVSRPEILERDPELYYGFWGQSMNDYRTTKPHMGYDILSRWRNDKCNKKKISEEIQQIIRDKVNLTKPFDDDEVRRLTPYNVAVVDKEGGDEGKATTPTAGAFHVFTSNVDAHFYDYFGAHEIHDCHGSIELWQCSSRGGCDSGIWRAPIPHTFCVDKRTMLAPQQLVHEDVMNISNKEKEDKEPPTKVEDSTKPATLGQTKGTGIRTNLLKGMPPGLDTIGWSLEEGTNWPKCGHCGKLARPAIFCFGDFGWKYDHSQEIRWEMWKEAMLDVTGCNSAKITDEGEDGSVAVCIMEIGCGTNVQTCRAVSEQMLEEVIEKGGKAQLVRINPDFPWAPKGSVAEQYTIPIQSTGLRAVHEVDVMYTTSLNS